MGKKSYDKTKNGDGSVVTSGYVREVSPDSGDGSDLESSTVAASTAAPPAVPPEPLMSLNEFMQTSGVNPTLAAGFAHVWKQSAAINKQTKTVWMAAYEDFAKQPSG